MDKTELKGAFLITGPSGVGKTSVSKALANKGYNTTPGVAHFIDRAGTKTAKPWHPDDPKWLSEHFWVFDKTWLNQAISTHLDNHIFIEAVTSDMDKYIEAFKSIFYLKLDPEQLARRIQSDPNGERYGAVKHQLEEIITGMVGLESWVKSLGGKIIPADSSPAEIADQIIAQAEKL